MRRHSLGPGVCYSEEIIGYMLKLLDPVKDATEISELKGKQKTLTGMGRAITPILVPLTKGAQLSDLVDANAAVTFDLDGSGLPVVELAAHGGLEPSRSAARRDIKAGALHVNGTPVTDDDRRVTRADLFHDRWVVLRRGKHNYLVVEFD